MANLHDIYNLLPQDITAFHALNSLTENKHGPQVSPMSYKNNSSCSSVKLTLTGTPGAVVPAGFMFSDVALSNIWIISTPTTLDGSGNADNVYAKCLTDGAITADAGTLTNITTSPSDYVSTINNPFDAVVAGESFNACIDKSTVDNSTYEQWADAMEANQPIATRQIITITI